MNIDIRKSIIHNFLESNESEIEEAITSSFQDKDELTLPGMGVFFELLWSNSDDNTKKSIIATIKKAISNQ